MLSEDLKKDSHALVFASRKLEFLIDFQRTCKYTDRTGAAYCTRAEADSLCFAMPYCRVEGMAIGMSPCKQQIGSGRAEYS